MNITFLAPVVILVKGFDNSLCWVQLFTTEDKSVMQIDDNYGSGPGISVHKILLLQTSSFSNIKYVYTSEQMVGQASE